MLRIIYCDHCGIWAALLTCPVCGLESRQVGIEGDWTTASSINLDPTDEIQGELISCGWCGVGMLVDELKPRTRRSGRSYTFAVDLNSNYPGLDR